MNIALRLGTCIQQPHCCCCGAKSDVLGHHSLSCYKNPCRLPCHAALNNAISRTLAAAGITAILELQDLDRGDCHQPDGITIFPFRHGKILMWDTTCINMFCATHINCASTTRAHARATEKRKRHCYAALTQQYDFVSLTVESSGVLGSVFGDLLQDISNHVTQCSGEPFEMEWLRQRISIVMVCGSTVAIRGALNQGPHH